MEVFLWIVSVALIGIGLAGTVLPVLPGTALILAGVALAGWIDDFTRIGTTTLVVEAVLTALSWVLEYLAGVLGARRAGASREAIVGAAIGTVVGLFMGLVGVFFMPLVGAAVGEFLVRRDHQGAWRVGLATWVGTLVGIVAKVVIGFMMVGVLIAALLIH